MAVVEQARNDHELSYQNWREFDYTFAAFSVIPFCLSHWAEHGIDVSKGFVYDIWKHQAERKGEMSKAGELGRAQKLVLDALRAVYDVAAFGDVGIQVTYQRGHDMAGRDLLLVLPGIGPTWVQMSVSASHHDYIGTKVGRRERRGDGQLPTFVLQATRSDCDTSRQPWVPVIGWYREMVDQLVALLGSDGDSDPPTSMMPIRGPFPLNPGGAAMGVS